MFLRYAVTIREAGKKIFKKTIKKCDFVRKSIGATKSSFSIQRIHNSCVTHKKVQNATALAALSPWRIGKKCEIFLCSLSLLSSASA